MAYYLELNDMHYKKHVLTGTFCDLCLICLDQQKAGKDKPE